MPQSTFKPTLDEVMADLEVFIDKYDDENRHKLMLAVSLAMVAHKGQVRKADPNSDLPPQDYIIHPLRVMLILGEECKLSSDVDLLTAAVLHDTVEDGGGKVTLEDIERSFGKRTRQIVDLVTKPPGKMTEEEHEVYYARISMHQDPRLAKMADRLDNLRNALMLSDKSFQRKQLVETRKYFLPWSALTGSYMHAELLSLLAQLEARVQ